MLKKKGGIHKSLKENNSHIQAETQHVADLSNPWTQVPRTFVRSSEPDNPSTSLSCLGPLKSSTSLSRSGSSK